MRAEVPVAFLPAHRRRVEPGQQRGGGLGSRPSARGRRRARSRSRRRGRPRSCGTAASAARASRAVQPVHQRMSVSVPGPKAASQRRRSSACATAGSSSSISPPSQAAVGTQRYCPLVHVVRGRPRTSFPCIASCGSTRAPALCVASQRDPTLRRSFFAQQRHGLRQVGGERLAALLHRLQRGRRRAVEPRRGALRDPAAFDPLLEPPALTCLDRVRAGRLHDGDEVPRHDEQRAAHAEHADEVRSSYSSRSMSAGCTSGRARLHREEDRGGVRRVEHDEAACDLERARARARPGSAGAGGRAAPAAPSRPSAARSVVGSHDGDRDRPLRPRRPRHRRFARPRTRRRANARARRGGRRDRRHPRRVPDSRRRPTARVAWPPPPALRASSTRSRRPTRSAPWAAAPSRSSAT